LPNLSVVAEDPRTEWTPILVADWYGRRKRTVEVVSATVVWHGTGLPAVPLRWVLIRDPHEEFATQALFWCTDLHADPAFSDALALVREELRAQEATFCGSQQENEMVKVPREFVERLTDAVCYAA
jgi:hypothetical protein